MTGGAHLALFTLLALAASLAMVRLLRGPSVPDRVVALDLLAAIGAGTCALTAVASGKTVFLDVAMLLALVSFVGTVAFARFVEWRGRE